MLPLVSTCTRITSPQWPSFMRAVGQPWTRRYGLGRSVGLGYGVCWARLAPANATTAVSTAGSVNPLRAITLTSRSPQLITAQDLLPGCGTDGLILFRNGHTSATEIAPIAPLRLVSRRQKC